MQKIAPVLHPVSRDTFDLPRKIEKRKGQIFLDRREICLQGVGRFTNYWLGEAQVTHFKMQAWLLSQRNINCHGDFATFWSKQQEHLTKYLFSNMKVLLQRQEEFSDFLKEEQTTIIF